MDGATVPRGATSGPRGPPRAPGRGPSRDSLISLASIDFIKQQTIRTNTRMFLFASTRVIHLISKRKKAARAFTTYDDHLKSEGSDGRAIVGHKQPHHRRRYHPRNRHGCLVTGVIPLMAQPRTSHRLTTRRISRSCVFLTTPRARGTAATYNQHIFMSRSQTPLLLNGEAHAPHPPRSTGSKTLSFLFLLPSFLFPFVLFSLEGGGGAAPRGRGEKTMKITRPPWAPSRARNRAAFSRNLPIEPGPADRSFAFYDFSK